ncbi:MAG TPA: TVP38/TMEM64 family protein, partial [Rhodoferax sp.]|nr:TVP38/TMEM64 family protein [Rhodoferax sp.]
MLVIFTWVFMKKIAVLLFVVALVLAFFAFDLNQELTLEGLKTGLDQIKTLRTQSPVTVAGVYFVGYVLVTALSLPGAVIMTLAGGAIFGLLVGTLVVSFASSLGATLAMLAARYVLRDSVQSSFGARLADIDKGIAREVAFYLFSLRLVPLFPFFVINLLMGLTKMKATTFYGVSQLGMLAGTVVYVNAGTQLARIESLPGILSPGLVVSFVLLGVFPLITKKIVDLVKARRIYAPWADKKP